jgi:glycine betaine/choline ABC-type transport system substrate-binding protein
VSRLRWLMLMMAVLALLAAACGDDDDDDATTDTGGASTEATTADTGSASTEGTTADTDATADTGGPAEGVALVLGAPADCETNAYCLPGLLEVYGVDMSGSFQALEAGQITVEALRAGEIDVANLFSTSPVIADEGWVLLEDDQGMLAADNIVPVLTDELVEVYGERLTGILDAISAELDTAELTALNAQVDIDRADPEEAADAWVEDAAIVYTQEAPPDGPQIVIGAQDFSESLILAQIYSQVLGDAGYDVAVQEVGGFRDLVVAAFDSGDINLTPEYAASMLEFLNDQAGEASSDPAATTELLNGYLADLGLQALTPSPAVDTNAFVVTAETAEEYGMATLSDLARVVNGS